MAYLHGLRPKFEEVPSNMIAGGIGGEAKTLGIAEIPIGMAGVCGTPRHHSSRSII